jgi:hypothetical protein
MTAFSNLLVKKKRKRPDWSKIRNNVSITFSQLRKRNNDVVMVSNFFFFFGGGEETRTMHLLQFFEGTGNENDVTASIFLSLNDAAPLAPLYKYDTVEQGNLIFEGNCFLKSEYQ